VTPATTFADRNHLSRLDVWAVEPFYGGSHKYFLDGLVAHCSHAITPLTLPGRNWKWRMHGGAIALAERARDLLSRESGTARPPDVIVASDMLDLPTFLAVAGPRLATVPVIVYFHENQLTYPLPPGTERDLGYGMKNVASALAAGSVLFNTAYHRREFFTAVNELLENMPDEVPSWIVPELEAKSKVIPVGCDLRGLDAARERGLADEASGRWGDPGKGPLVVWNQRWEYDKAPEELLAALLALKEEGVPFRLAIAGSNHGTPPPEFDRAREELGDRVVQWGRVPQREDYASLLWAADVVASTAIHEFFGVAVVEAVYCGCRPVLPARLSYPEIIPPEAHERVLYGEGEFKAALRDALARPRAWSEDWQRTWVARYDWAGLHARYDEEIRRCWRMKGEGA
jgi:glycosyltransferase involved in cell wall biosynthesis